MRNASFDPMLIVMLSIIGPYLIKDFGVRVDHVVIYFLLMLSIHKINLLRGRNLIVSLLLLLGGAIPIISEVTSRSVTNFAQVFAGLDNYTLFFSCFVVTCVHLKSQKDVFYTFNLIGFYLKVLSFNTIIATISAFFDISSVLNFFHSTTLGNLNLGVQSVSQNAAGMYRFSGIFDQPLEAGFAYSVGLFCIIYLVSVKHLSRPELIAYLSFVLLGGLLSISKVFVYGGIPLGLLYASYSLRLQLTWFLWALLSLSVALIIIYNVSDDAQAFSFLFRLLTGERFLEELLFGRFDHSSSMADAFADILFLSPLVGFGFTGPSIYDSGYLQYFYQGGFFGIAIQLFLLCYVNYGIHSQNKKMRLFFFAVTALQIGALLGGPTMLSNRASIFLAVLYAMALQSPNRTFAAREPLKNSHDYRL